MNRAWKTIATAALTAAMLGLVVLAAIGNAAVLVEALL